MNEKKIYGQFYTTNYKYILQNLNIPNNITHIIEPFCGNADLLNFFDNKKYNIEMYDISPKKTFITKKNTLLTPPNYTNKFIITNPPYLARNKSDDKTIFDKYNVNDLYKAFIKNIISNPSLGGIIIIPLNFWSSIRKNDITLRKEFINIYQIIQLNIFEENVFKDTTYTVCSFLFLPKTTKSNKIKATIFPTKKYISFHLSNKNNFIIGGNIYNLKHTHKYNVYRATKNNKHKLNTNILVKCIDDNKNNMISLSLVDNKQLFIDETPKLTARTYATLIIEPHIDIDKQKNIINKFNTFLNKHRQKYHSLFLTNYRESKDIARKRISFDLVYNIIKYLLEK